MYILLLIVLVYEVCLIIFHTFLSSLCKGALDFIAVVMKGIC
jgi:hypothetical protein